MMPHRRKHWRLNKDTLIQIVVVVVFATFVIVEVVDLVHDYKTTRQNDTPPSQSLIQIQPWMTFSYINFLYDLPEGYLKSTLAIPDMRYPNVEIRHYAKKYGIDQATLIHAIAIAIIHYGVRP
ncbi:MAG TPA: hypothetical protein VG621_00445 [Candidatus Paceibacterota bacterium]|nr:hypothetical protein [Candidatus Paceibacterota bacterium]